MPSEVRRSVLIVIVYWLRLLLASGPLVLYVCPLSVDRSVLWLSDYVVLKAGQV